MQGKVCPYCRKKTKCVPSHVIYGRDYDRNFWHCKGCKALVSCHRGTKNAMGRLSTEKDRKHKHTAHEWFDRLWKEEHMTRHQAYDWLSEYLGIPHEYTHIGMFSTRTCLRVIEGSKMLLNDLKRLDKFLLTNKPTNK